MHPHQEKGLVLSLNGGSSSLKLALFPTGEHLERRMWGTIERMGTPEAKLDLHRDEGSSRSRPVEAPDQASAVQAILAEIDAAFSLTHIKAVGHRIVHGGPRYQDPVRITDEVLSALRDLSTLDPAHLPAEIAVIEAVRRALPDLPQVACFDTAFHRTLPRVARLLPLPRRYDADGVRRYGFHGLSYAFLMEELARIAGPTAAKGRIVLAHLGSGASLAAVRDGQCIDTTMGFTPTGGIVMGTRSGDLDPGVIAHLMRREHLDADALDALVNRQSGLRGVSETSADMRDLLAREADDPRAAEAVALFCYQAKKAVGALSAALGGLDTLVFAGGVGEHAPVVRARIADGLEHLGVRLDSARNQAGEAVVSADGSPATVRVMHTDEEQMIARETKRLLEIP